MKQGIIGALLIIAGLGFGMTQAPAEASSSPAPPGANPVAVEADELQGGSCGDRLCQPPEDCNTCPQDCGECCGNRRCEPPEDCNSCPQDCPCS